MTSKTSFLKVKGMTNKTTKHSLKRYADYTYELDSEKIVALALNMSDIINLMNESYNAGAMDVINKLGEIRTDMEIMPPTPYSRLMCFPIRELCLKKEQGNILLPKHKLLEIQKLVIQDKL